MKIALLGATGNIGRAIAREALARGHHLTALVRSDRDLPAELDGAGIARVAPGDEAALATAVAGHDVLASAFGPGTGSPALIPATAQQLVAAARGNGIRRLVVVGGAGSLEVAPGVQLVDTPGFPEAYKPQALAHRQAYALLRGVDDLDWTFFAPAAEIGPGPRRGDYRTQARALLADTHGNSTISHADYASAFVDEIERPQYLRQIATAAY